MRKNILVLSLVLSSFSVSAEQLDTDGSESFAKNVVTQTQFYIANLERSSKNFPSGYLHDIHQYELSLLDGVQHIVHPKWNE
jgi:hypothetical protein